ncbi:CHASE3 domain-containing protein [Rhodoferax sp.]|uniref:CHASE3 domain-containing protein n=1 Tax=Rhodoferax sp. TaxID=50421 RepID=UPI0025FC0A36|nr:CHASE3 domain-containing protein [Rhodoferax sp.]
MRFIKVVRGNRIAFSLAGGFALAILLISEGSYQRSVARLDAVPAMSQARNSIQSLVDGVVNAETSERGYLVTGRAEYRAPYDEAIKKVSTSLEYLVPYYSNKPEAAVILSRLQTATETKLSELALTIQLIDEGKPEAAKEIMMSDIGKEQMEIVRKTTNELQDYELRNITQNRQGIYASLMLSHIGVAGLMVLGLLALFMYLRQIFLFTQQQIELQRMLQAERNQLEAEVLERTAQLTQLAQHLQTAREDERNRLARNLHDDLGSLLTSAKLDAARIKSRLMATAPEALDLLAHLVSTLNSGIALGRRIIEDLRPSALSNLGLVSTLEILAREFADSTEVQVHTTLAPVELNPAAELMVYRLVQEAITNITKYAKAKQVWIELGTHNNEVEVSVRDDGVGFNTSTKPQSAYGLVGMRFRVEAEGGVLSLASAPGQGTLIRAKLPAAVLKDTAAL